MTTKIKVIDSMMGTGKTSVLINHINNNPEDNFIFITPYLDEIKRIKESTKAKNKMYEPSYNRGKTKKAEFHNLLSQGKNICSTHALFKRADDITRLSLKANNYILVLDEVMDVVEEMNFTKNDMDLLLNENLAYIEDDFLKWNKDKEDYNGRYNDIKNMALNNNLICIGDKLIFWNFPIDIFTYFKEVYILTYMFDCQIQRYYYDFHNVEYKKYQVDDNYKIVDYTDELHNERKKKLIPLINIYDNEKYNSVGDNKYALSKTWFEKYEDNLVKTLGKNVYNYFNNTNDSTNKDRLWTTFKDYKTNLQGRGYTKRFISMNIRATNDYKDTFKLAYCCNRYIRPNIKTFFSKRNISVNEDDFALSEMLQWIWRSRIRQNQPIEIYIPSSRMRRLLHEYLDI